MTGSGFEDLRTPEGRAALSERLEREIAETEADLARRRYDRRTEELLAMRPDPPPLPPPTPAAVVGPDLVTRATMDRALGSFAEAVGEATGTMGREAEKTLAEEVAKLRAEIEAKQLAALTELRAEMLALQGTVLDLRSEVLALREAAPGPARKPNGTALHA